MFEVEFLGEKTIFSLMKEAEDFLTTRVMERCGYEEAKARWFARETVTNNYCTATPDGIVSSSEDGKSEDGGYYYFV